MDRALDKAMHSLHSSLHRDLKATHPKAGPRSVLEGNPKGFHRVFHL